ncbi:hypothetical protein DM02DRAFT_315693 [Periconia macrospinosa]|uniref:Uncharacterized protein n=1 Tax=Periconia macrospinosa TaxID=97972 RepID=A0A2V1D182_9PLEO|nr:hypothetical protein DM02DRAFT_315693 [Periconia macrospinosa]
MHQERKKERWREKQNHPPTPTIVTSTTTTPPLTPPLSHRVFLFPCHALDASNLHFLVYPSNHPPFLKASCIFITVIPNSFYPIMSVLSNEMFLAISFEVFLWRLHHPAPCLERRTGGRRTTNWCGVGMMQSEVWNSSITNCVLSLSLSFI